MMNHRPRSRPPYFTAATPGIGGVLKSQPDDFVVEELPAYEPCGSGEHLYLWIEKREVSAEQFQRHLSSALGIRPADIGVAGLKDRLAITRQYVSVPGHCAKRVAAIDTERIRVLRTARHGNKLRTGHLKGNRFDIVLREVVDDALERAGRISAELERGFPNFYGDQRFGNEDETLTLGLDLLTGRRTVGDIPRKRRRFLLRFSLSAVQSALFNEVLSRRMADGLLRNVLAGDVMQVVTSGGLFVAMDPGVEQTRSDAGETAITGPMFGPEMNQPEGVVAAREAEVLAAHQLTPEHFVEWRRLASGTRRPLQVRWSRFECTSVPGGLRLQFDLPRGVYATTLLREFQKQEIEDRPGLVDAVASDSVDDD